MTKVLRLRFASVSEEQLGFSLDLRVQVRVSNHGIDREGEPAAEIDAGDHCRYKREGNVRFRQELGVVLVEFEDCVGNIRRLPPPLRRGVGCDDRLLEFTDALSVTLHLWRPQHELGQCALNLRHQSTMFIFEQFIDVVAAIHSDHQMRDLAADVVLEGRACSQNLAFIPSPQRMSALVDQLRQIPPQRGAGISALKRLAHPVVLGAIHARHGAGGSERTLQVLDVVLRAQVEPPVLVDPLIGVRPHQGDYCRFADLEGKLDDRSVLLKDALHRLGDIAREKITLSQDVGESELGNGFGLDDTTGLRCQGAVPYRAGNRPPYQIQLGERLDPLQLLLVVFR